MSSVSNKFRRWIRNYGWKRVRWGRSGLRKLMLPWMERHQTVELAPGLWIDLELKNDRCSHYSQDVVFWFYEEMEAPLQWAIRNLMPLGGTMMDCGANTGIMGLLAAYHRGAKVHFIEPHPKLGDQICRSIDLNKFQNRCWLHRGAASDQTGTVHLTIDSVNDGGHSVAAVADPLSCPVPAFRLDELIQKHSISTIDLLKVDTEGHDLQVLTGLGNCLNPDFLRSVYVEKSDEDPVQKLLTDRGYRPFQSRKVYIDELRRWNRESEDRLFFYPVEVSEAGKDCLWCPPGSPMGVFLKDHCAPR